MSWPLSIALFFVIWWTLLFAVLPLGVRTQAEAGEIVPGTPASAPAMPRLKRAFLINTVLSIVVFAVVYAAIEFNIFNIDGPVEPPGAGPAARP
jgi:predicted secreted protein